jgi:hypothetical protein
MPGAPGVSDDALQDPALTLPRAKRLRLEEHLITGRLVIPRQMMTRYLSLDSDIGLKKG